MILRLNHQVDELRNAALGAARYSAVTAAVTSRCGGEGLANDSLIAGARICKHFVNLVLLLHQLRFRTS
jgi:hypothetical protein